MNRWNEADRFRLLKLLAGEDRSVGEIFVRFCSSAAFRFLVLAVAIAGAAFAVRTSDAFQSAQFAALRAETIQRVASAADVMKSAPSPATQITAVKPRLLKTVALERTKPDATRPAISTAKHTGLGNASPDVLCKTFGSGSSENAWDDSPLFADQNECFADHAGNGFVFSQAARGLSDTQVDTIRFTLEIANDKATEDASSVLKRELDETLEVSELTAPSGFTESVGNLEEAKAESGPITYKFEREIANQNRYTLSIQKKNDEKSPRLVQFRPQA